MFLIHYGWLGQAVGTSKGSSAANLKAAELYVGAFKGLAKVETIKKSLRFIMSPRSKKLSTPNTNYRTLAFPALADVVFSHGTPLRIEFPMNAGRDRTL